MSNENERMTYREAASYLEVNIGSLNHAIGRGVLTPLPRQGVIRHLPTKQVKLFKGKPLALSSLTQDESKVWEKCAEEAKGMPTHHTMLPYLSPDVGLTQGERFGQNFSRGVHKGILGYDPSTEEALRSPLAV